MVNGERHFEVRLRMCGCNLCVSVCPVENCITMGKPLSPGQLDERTGEIVKEAGDWTVHQIIQRMLQNKNVYGGKKKIYLLLICSLYLFSRLEI
ncbi:MAG: hypothetical protein CM15mP117_00980 [Alphaproteobacteria bacterium]|nr:MAG: hypothetical protein CM15mP117_00980 [Alphaproteobacteria bacterium]